MTSDTTQCEDDCGNRATAVYEVPVPPADSTRVKLCWNCSPDVTPVRFIDTGTLQKPTGVSGVKERGGDNE